MKMRCSVALKAAAGHHQLTAAIYILLLILPL